MEGGSFWRHGFDFGGDLGIGGESEVLFHFQGEMASVRIRRRSAGFLHTYDF